MPRSILALLALCLASCDIPPKFVEKRDIENAMVRSKYKTVCKGLEMKDDSVREFATERLTTVDDPFARECICEHIPHRTKQWDPAIANGLKGTQRDELATCFADLVKKPDLPRRLEAVVALANIPAPSARKALSEIASDTTAEPEPRAAAIKAISGDPAYKDLQMGMLSGDADPSVRAAAADGLGSLKTDDVAQALKTAFENDKEGAVRAAALASMRKLGVDGIDEVICKAMMDDESADVRRAAVGAFKGTKRAEAVACLRKRAFTEESDSGVRDELLKVLKSSPSDDAAMILCDAIPFWMRTYAVKDIPEKIPGTGIIKAQNDRDWDRTYECLEKALRQSTGYSCYARMYVGGWFRIVGGTAGVPICPGYEGQEVVIGAD